ncbi:right-handed parallel beta-helix repeat-containing protein [candidate division KSB1 bacterium]|nr:right-handed parallel beta-helix repeat-containing protein [candidate division KSB1 bacterium]
MENFLKLFFVFCFTIGIVWAKAHPVYEGDHGGMLAFVQQQTISGILPADTTLTGDNGPWQVTGDLVIPADVTLTILAGTVVYFDSSTGITVQEGGRLVAAGHPEDRILFSPQPGKQYRWDGIEFNRTLQENVLKCVDMINGDRRSQAVLVRSSKLQIDSMTWTESNKTVLELEHPSIRIQNSVFPNVGSVEVIHGLYLEGDEYLILEGNTFGSTIGYNDVIDFSGAKRPGPVFQAYNNVFLGGGDDGLDLDGADAHIEGNLFKNFHFDHTGGGTSAAIATGERLDLTSDITVVRNVFLNNDHAVLLKENCYMHAENNTFINCNPAAVNFSEWPSRDVVPGKGAFLTGNIFWKNNAVLENQFSQPGYTNPVISIFYSIVPAEFHNLGSGNLDIDPMFVSDNEMPYLQPGSPAIGTGPNGLDMGAMVPPGVSVSGVPDSVTTDTTAVLTIGGPGIVSYRYRIVELDTSWSGEIDITEQPQIFLTGLLPGKSYQLHVKGKNSAGVWQENPEYQSIQWTVQQLVNRTEPDRRVIHGYHLYQSFPNPFNGSTRIKFRLAKAEFVTLEVNNIKGETCATLFGGRLTAGSHTINWQPGNLASGIYFCVLHAGMYRQKIKVLYMK